ncbi:uncharacterized protein RCC_03268 [Ramularia collo-cygni]|uniref:UBX domain-containing protein n=1 Tax=Ramularia collo-cygni TaxID=112498 RepID=A0A2D3V4M1_9PEZI|nr:uncharacterized protein RCC_03268 [Ramularia collo-cygni]CZT17434.1 uncharacterized protein RCC_03268 [Ramularia collo-cygni]
MAYFTNLEAAMRSTDWDKLKELAPTTLLIVITIGFVGTVLANILRRVEEDPIDRQTRINTAKNRPKKRTTINHFAANSVHIFNNQSPDQVGVESLRRLSEAVNNSTSDGCKLVPERSDQGIQSPEYTSQASPPPDDDDDLREPTPREFRGSLSETARANSVHIRFRTRDNPTGSTLMMFSNTKTVGDVFAWIRSQSLLSEGKEGLELRLLDDERGRTGRAIGVDWSHFMIGKGHLDLDGGEFLIDFFEKD